MRVSHISINVEVDPGTVIDTAFTEAVNLAGKLGIVVEFKFNGVSCIAFPAGNASQGVNEYHKVLADRRQYPIAVAR